MSGTITVGDKILASHDNVSGKLSMSGDVDLANVDMSNMVFPPLGNSAVGTVSQSSGTPTGDVIERGSNSNGEYVKFADGTLICTASEIVNPTADGSWGGLYRTLNTGNAVWTYPHTFISTPILMASGDDFNRISYIRNVPRLYSADIGNISSNLDDNGAVSCLAIGRWY